MTKILLAIVLSANIFFTFAKADDEIPQANEIIENPDQQTKIPQVFGQTELNQINEKNILSPEYIGVLQSGRLHYGIGVVYDIRQKLVKLACGLTLPQFEFMVSDAATKLTNKSINDAALRILAEDIVATGVGAKDKYPLNSNNNPSTFRTQKESITNNILQSVNMGSIRLISQGVLKAAISLDRPYRCRNRVANEYFQSTVNKMKSINMKSYQRFLQMFKFNCEYCENQYSASVKIAQLQASSEHNDNNNVAMGQVTGLALYTGGIGIKNPPLAAGIAVFGGLGIVAMWTNKEANINNIESASKDLAKAQFDMCKTDCNNSSDIINAAKMRLKYEDGVNKVSKEFNSTNHLQESEAPIEIGKQNYIKQKDEQQRNPNNQNYDLGPEHIDDVFAESTCQSTVDKILSDPVAGAGYSYELYTEKLSRETNNSIDLAFTRLRGFLRTDPRLQNNKYGYAESALYILADKIEKKGADLIARTEFSNDPFGPKPQDYVARMLKFSNAERMRIELKWLHNNQEVFCR